MPNCIGIHDSFRGDYGYGKIVENSENGLEDARKKLFGNLEILIHMKQRSFKNLKTFRCRTRFMRYYQQYR